MDLKDLSNGVRGAGGTVTIPVATAKELKLKTVEETANGGARVDCEELVSAVDKMYPDPEPETEPAKENADTGDSKPTSGNNKRNRGSK